MGIPFRIVTPKHGDKGDCPTCGASGIFDTTTPAGTILHQQETNWIWYNNCSRSWECGECWLK